MDKYLQKILLTVIALALSVIAVHTWIDTPRVHADSGTGFFVEPGTVSIPTADHLAQTQGKMVVNLQNGDIWGFPTTITTPYPVDTTSQQPPVSKPVYLGRFDFAAMKR